MDYRSQIDAMMNRISALLATAESLQSQGNSEAAKTYREKAESLMRKYRLEEEQLIREAVSSGQPIWKHIEIGAYDSEWETVLSSMFYYVANHCGIEYVTRAVRKDERVVYMAHAVGYEMDLRLAEMIMTSARLAFLTRLEPVFDPALSPEENIYRLRGSGMDRQRVAEKVFGQKGHQEGIRVGKIYKAECERRGEVDAISGRGFNAEAYRAAYADQFNITIARRLREARDAADSVGGALVLPEREKRVKEALYTKYPSMRPMTDEELAEYRAQQEKRAAEEGPSKAVDRRRKSWTAEDQKRYDRLHNTPAAQRARRAGRDAARSVELTREAPRSPRTGSAERNALEG